VRNNGRERCGTGPGQGSGAGDCPGRVVTPVRGKTRPSSGPELLPLRPGPRPDISRPAAMRLRTLAWLPDVAPVPSHRAVRGSPAPSAGAGRGGRLTAEAAARAGRRCRRYRPVSNAILLAFRMIMSNQAR
jgi:hypothetical protein